MEALTALGLAANIAQFVGYAMKLVSTSREIHNSMKGSTSKVAMLDEVYGKLQDLNSRLGSCQEGNGFAQKQLAGAGVTEFIQHIDAINDLSRVCKVDCDKLLGVTAKLKGKEGRPSPWTSFKAAIKTMWKGDEIAELEQRLHYTQSTLTLHICALISFYQESYRYHIEMLRLESNELNVQQSKKLDAIERALEDLSRPSQFSPTDISALEKQMSDLTMGGDEVLDVNMIIKSLSFDSRLARYGSIEVAHENTFRWVFEDRQHPNSGSTAGNLFKWLKDGDGIFWVSGKPGSGKSTLMKFIVDHPTTSYALNAWASPQPVVVASHFFWSAGTAMQKSRQGLLQTLLSSIFRQEPGLIEDSCSHRRSEKSKRVNTKEPWDTVELARVIERVVQGGKISTKFCFFIDGLDEFEGDHIEFCQALKELSTSPYVKLCVSSRPWNVFEDSFGRNISSKLYIHELTRNDIRTYVQDSLEAHPRWASLGIEEDNAKFLINEITQRAAGVFIWVYLVTKQLRSGLTEHDSFSDLQERLETIPDDLEAFFKQILESVDPFYHRKMASMLQIALTAREPALAAIYNFHDMEYGDVNYALKLPVKAQSEEQIASNLETTRRRLNARCRGFLEINAESNCVEFLHRTVMDYLRTDEMVGFLERRTGTGFNANLSLLKAFVAYIKSTKFPDSVYCDGFAEYSSSKLTIYLKEALAYARELQKSTNAHQLLEELDRCMPEMHKNGQVILKFEGGPRGPGALLVRELTIEASLVGYLDYILHKTPDYFSEFSQPIIGEIIELFPQYIKGRDYHDPIDMFGYLLEHGHDPNSSYTEYYTDEKSTAWSLFLYIAFDQRFKLFGRFVESDLFSLMLRHGADPHAGAMKEVKEVEAWISFARHSLDSSLTTETKQLSLEVLDDFIAACAVMQKPPTTEARLDSPQTPGDKHLYELLDALSKEPNSANNWFFAGVTEKVLHLAKINKYSVDHYG
ncbi:hypothetical protein F4804DRAFT_167764 [Jackrogersella minutella]|nr:hypothetical protein F4804DRAFT_167764 [Jackrogersella minutella]